MVLVAACVPVPEGDADTAGQRASEEGWGREVTGASRVLHVYRLREADWEPPEPPPPAAPCGVWCYRSLACATAGARSCVSSNGVTLSPSMRDSVSSWPDDRGAARMLSAVPWHSYGCHDRLLRQQNVAFQCVWTQTAPGHVRRDRAHRPALRQFLAADELSLMQIADAAMARLRT